MELVETDPDYPVIPTYPFEKKDIDVELAVEYMIVVLNQNRIFSVAQLQNDMESIFCNQIQWLRLRLNDTIINWCSVSN